MKNKKLFALGGLALLIGVSYASANELKLDALKSASFKNIGEDSRLLVSERNHH